MVVDRDPTSKASPLAAGPDAVPLTRLGVWVGAVRGVRKPPRAEQPVAGGIAPWSCVTIVGGASIVSTISIFNGQEERQVGKASGEETVQRRLVEGVVEPIGLDEQNEQHGANRTRRIRI